MAVDFFYKNLKIRKHKNNSLCAGFTLAESLVAVGIFVIVVVSVVDIYLLYVRSQSATQKRQNILNLVSFSLEKIAQDVRTKEIVFTDNPSLRELFGFTSQFYSLDNDIGIVGSEKELILLNPDDATGYSLVVYVFKEEGQGGSLCGDYTQKGIYRYSGETNLCEPLLVEDNLEIVKVIFYISPSYNPYPDSDQDCRGGTFNGYLCTCDNNDQCWAGTSCAKGFCTTIDEQPRVTVYLEIEDTSEATAKTFSIQTTISSRIYKR